MGHAQRMRSEELKTGFCGRAQMVGAEKRNLELGIPAGNGGSREMGHLEDFWVSGYSHRGLKCWD